MGIALALVVAGVASCAAGLVWAALRLRWVRAARRVAGRVIDATGAGEDETWTLTVAYPAADGSEAMMQAELATSVDPPQPGTSIGVLVAGDPPTARLDRAAETWIGPIGAVAAGILLATTGAILLVTG